MNEAAAAVAVAAATALPATATTRGPRTKLTAKQKYEQSAAASAAAADMAAKAVQSGMTLDSAKQMGVVAANAAAKSYAQSVVGGTATAAGPGPAPPVGTSLTGPTPAEAATAINAPWRTVGAAKNRNKISKLSKRNPYKSGTNDAPVRSVAPVKPEYLSNKCLVISGIDLGITEAQWKESVNEKVDKQIDFKAITTLSKEGSSWITVAVELSDEDYELLANPDIWGRRIRLRPFTGWRFWRGERPQRPKPDQLRTAVRMQWT